MNLLFKSYFQKLYHDVKTTFEEKTTKNTKRKDNNEGIPRTSTAGSKGDKYFWGMEAVPPPIKKISNKIHYYYLTI